MKLELKHLAPYLPYGLQCMAQGEGKKQFELQGISDISYADLHEIGRTVCEQYDFEDTFPILRPLSDLTIDEEFYSSFFRTFSDEDNVGYICESKSDVSNQGLSYSCILFLIENHFDVFGLIEKGLAIDKNTLK